jgi:hypothetical protein
MLVFITASIVHAEETITKIYTLPNHGNLQLSVPQLWKDDLRQPTKKLPPTIVFTSQNSSLFQVLLTPVISVPKEVMPTTSKVKATIESKVEQIKSQAVESNIIIRELKGSEVEGYYFSATDKSPKPGEYKYMTQGIFLVGNLASTFTILTNDGDEKIIDDSISMLKSAVHVY